MFPSGLPQDTAARLRERTTISLLGCWLWSGAVNNNGYGVISVQNRHRYVHRIAWELGNGPIPDGLFVCHRCDTPRCLRPDHLFLGTPSDNMQDMHSKGRGRRNYRTGDSHPMHKLTEEQALAIRADGRRTKILAELYGVSRSSIRMIRAGTTWRHL